MLTTDAGGARRRAELLVVANVYFEALAERDFPAMPYAETVTLAGCLVPGSREAALEGKESVRAIWWPPLARVLGEVTVLEHYLNEDLTAICTELQVTVGDPPVTLHVLNRLEVDGLGEITDQVAWSRPVRRSP